MESTKQKQEWGVYMMLIMLLKSISVIKPQWIQSDWMWKHSPPVQIIHPLLEWYTVTAHLIRTPPDVSHKPKEKHLSIITWWESQEICCNFIQIFYWSIDCWAASNLMIAYIKEKMHQLWNCVTAEYTIGVMLIDGVLRSTILHVHQHTKLCLIYRFIHFHI